VNEWQFAGNIAIALNDRDVGGLPSLPRVRGRSWPRLDEQRVPAVHRGSDPGRAAQPADNGEEGARRAIEVLHLYAHADLLAVEGSVHLAE